MTHPRFPRFRLAGVGGLAALALAGPGARSASAGPGGAYGPPLDALHAPDLFDVRAADPSGELARLGADGRDETAWTGRAGETRWVWTSTFARPVHLGLVRAHFGRIAISGVPTAFHWETMAPKGDGMAPPVCGRADARATWEELAGASRMPPPSGDSLAQPTRRSWFADVEACGLRLVVDQTNAGPPVVREVQALEAARDVLRAGQASDDGAYPEFDAAAAIDGAYATRWAGATGRGRWTLRVDLAEPETVDRIRMVLGFDATSVRRPGSGRNYAVAWGPVRYVLEISEDGRRFTPVATEPVRPDGSIVPLRRRLVLLRDPPPIRALRLVMTGATGASGLPEADAVPVVRELAAYRRDDRRPILPEPWILSVNANPSGQSKFTPGGELTNDAYHAKFLQSAFAPLLPALRQDDRYARALGTHGEPLDAPPHREAGEVLESIEADDPQLDASFLSQSSPPPIAVLGGSNDWDYAVDTGPDARHPKRWYWNPVRDARGGGIGQLAPAVQSRVAPFVGFCGGAQLLALLESLRAGESRSPDHALDRIDRILRRTSGRPIRGFAPPMDVERAWPTDPRPVRAKVQFVASDPLFADLAGPFMRSSTQALPELHSDAIRPDAFLPGGPLERFEVLATSSFCGADVVPATASDAVPNPNGSGWCDTVPEAFRSRDPSLWPIIGTQFHAEQHNFSIAAPGDPPESVADPRLFLAAAFDSIIDAYVRLAP